MSGLSSICHEIVYVDNSTSAGSALHCGWCYGAAGCDEHNQAVLHVTIESDSRH
jgi:hypothetical protein